MRRGTVIAVALLGIGTVAAVGGLWLGHASSGAASCRVVVDGHSYVLDREQATNAATITAAAKAEGLPDHAVTVGIAAALQESGLHNLTHGDRDSLGLFQQRPSQGWGTPAQILDPTYAATAFFRDLARIDNWQAMPVDRAAQLVQRSAAPSAYAKWEGEARTIARATTGEVPGALTCAP